MTNVIRVVNYTVATTRPKNPNPQETDFDLDHSHLPGDFFSVRCYPEHQDSKQTVEFAFLVGVSSTPTENPTARM